MNARLGGEQLFEEVDEWKNSEDVVRRTSEGHKS